MFDFFKKKKPMSETDKLVAEIYGANASDETDRIAIENFKNAGFDSEKTVQYMKALKGELSADAVYKAEDKEKLLNMAQMQGIQMCVQIVGQIYQELNTCIMQKEYLLSLVQSFLMSVEDYIVIASTMQLKFDGFAFSLYNQLLNDDDTVLQGDVILEQARKMGFGEFIEFSRFDANCISTVEKYSGPTGFLVLLHEYEKLSGVELSHISLLFLLLILQIYNGLLADGLSRNCEYPYFYTFSNNYLLSQVEFVQSYARIPFVLSQIDQTIVPGLKMINLRMQQTNKNL